MPCPECGGAFEMVNSNGVTDPNQDRWEEWQCVECRYTTTKVLKA